MIARASASVLLGAVGFLGTTVTPATAASCTWVTQVIVVDGHVEPQTYMECPEIRTSPASDHGGESKGPEIRDSNLDTVCVNVAISVGAEIFGYCGIPTDPVAAAPAAAVPQVTPGLALSALRRVGLPESRLVVQPADGETLVNFETNFYTEAGPFSRSLRMLGRTVELRIWPSGYAWRFGDGESARTESPGAAYPDLEVTHAYRRAGEVAAAVDTTYSAEFRVDGGAWRDVPGTVTMTGQPVQLLVRTARPTLVGG